MENPCGVSFDRLSELAAGSVDWTGEHCSKATGRHQIRSCRLLLCFFFFFFLSPPTYLSTKWKVASWRWLAKAALGCRNRDIYSASSWKKRAFFSCGYCGLLHHQEAAQEYISWDWGGVATSSATHLLRDLEDATSVTTVRSDRALRPSGCRPTGAVGGMLDCLVYCCFWCWTSSYMLLSSSKMLLPHPS